MTRRWQLAMVAAALALGAAPSARTQTLREPESRQGFYVSAGAGANTLGVWDKGRRDDTAAGLAYTLRFGEMLTERWGWGWRSRAAAPRAWASRPSSRGWRWRRRRGSGATWPRTPGRAWASRRRRIPP